MPAASKDPTEAIRNEAAAFPEVLKGTSCTQSSFKTARGAFLYIGPGAKGVGYKMMLKLDASRDRAAKLAAEQPERFELGSGQWVVARFTAEKPLPASIWRKWVAESYALSCGAAAAAKKQAKK